MEHLGIPITGDGCFLAYKGVTENFLDKHSHTIDNTPGNVIEYPRNEVSDDFRAECHAGLHVGDLSYARGFATKTIIVKVRPEDVVSIPYDQNQRKMRVCRYEVVGLYSDKLPDDIFEEPLATDEVEDEAPTVTEVVSPSPAMQESDRKKRKNKAAATREADPNAELDEPSQLPEDRPLAKAVITKKVVKKFKQADKFSKLSFKDLMEESLDDLRQYATYGLLIVGASKVSGGKAALIGKILTARKKLAAKG